jgi:hypothetical protein
METEEIDAEGMIEGELEGGTAVAPQEGTLGETDGETAGVAPEDEPNGELNGETAGVLEGGEPYDEIAGVLGDGDPEILEGGEPNGKTAGVLGDEDPNSETTGVFGDEHAPSNEEGDITDSDNQPSASKSESNDSDSDTDEVHSEITDEDVYHPDTMTPSVKRTYGLRPRKPRDYSHKHAMIIHHAMTQYSVKSGLKKIKEKGEKAVSQELLQLHTMNTFAPQDSTKLTPAQKYGALESMMLLKENRDGHIKGSMRRRT